MDTTTAKALRAILKRMKIQTKKTADTELQKKFEEAVTGGTVPENLSTEEVALLKGLGYDVQGTPEPTDKPTTPEEAKPTKAAEDAPAAAKPTKEKKAKKPKAEKKAKAAKPKKEPATRKDGTPRQTLGIAQWFRDFWDGKKSATRKELYTVYKKKFPTADPHTCRFYVHKAKTDDSTWGFTLTEAKDDEGNRTLTQHAGKAKKARAKAGAKAE